MDEFLPLYIVMSSHVIGTVLIPLVFLTEPRVSMLHSSQIFLSAQYWKESVVYLVATATIEIFALNFWMRNFLFLVIMSTLSSSATLTALASITADLNASAQSVSGLESTCQRLRTIQMWMALSNNVNAWTLYCIKLACMTIAIHHGYIAIRHFHANVPIGILSYFLAVNTAVAFGAMSDNAFKLTRRAQDLRQQIEANMVTDSSVRRSGFVRGLETELRLVRRLLRSLPGLHVKMGCFGAVERKSTMIFIGFVIGQIVNLLVTFP